MPIRLTAAGRTDVGRRRARNEDSLHVASDGRLLVVADGMGGHPGGDRASRLAVERLSAHLADGTPPGGAAASSPADPGPSGSPSGWSERWGGWMAEAVRAANRAVLAEAERVPRLRGMGTTLTALLVDPEAGRAVVGHVGDSRAYRLPADGPLRVVTTDHTWIQDRVDAGEMDREAARTHPMAHVLARAIGLEEGVPADVETVPVEPGDLHLLCSDGLTGMVPEAELETLLREGRDGDPDALAAGLVEEANRRGGTDNVTVALLRVE